MNYQKQFYLFLSLLNKVVGEVFNIVENENKKDANVVEIEIPYFYQYDFLKILQEDGTYQIKKFNKNKNNKIFEKKFQNIENLVKNVIKQLVEKAGTKKLYKVKYSENQLNFMYYTNLIDDKCKKISAKIVFLAEK